MVVASMLFKFLSRRIISLLPSLPGTTALLTVELFIIEFEPLRLYYLIFVNG